MHELKISHMLEDLPFPLNMPLIWWVIKCAIIGSNFHLKRLPRSSRKGDAGRNFLEEHFLLQKLFSVWKKRDCWLWSCTTYGFSTVVSLWRKTQHPQIRGKKGGARSRTANGPIVERRHLCRPCHRLEGHKPSSSTPYSKLARLCRWMRMPRAGCPAINKLSCLPAPLASPRTGPSGREISK